MSITTTWNNPTRPTSTTWNKGRLQQNVIPIISSGFWNDLLSWDDSKIWVDTGGLYTEYIARIKPGDWTYYTWGNAPDTWGSANQTWGEYGFGMASTNWNNPR